MKVVSFLAPYNYRQQHSNWAIIHNKVQIWIQQSSSVKINTASRILYSISCYPNVRSPAQAHNYIYNKYPFLVRNETRTSFTIADITLYIP
jgi:hypothetical protein